MIFLFKLEIYFFYPFCEKEDFIIAKCDITLYLIQCFWVAIRIDKVH